jgi:signal transduction protein with GAF and PtsI domain
MARSITPSALARPPFASTIFDFSATASLPSKDDPTTMTRGRTLSGVAASDGIAIGEARLLMPPVVVIERRISPELVPAEVTRLRQAVTAPEGAEMEALLAQALSLRSEIEVEELVLAVMRRRFPLELASGASE